MAKPYGLLTDAEYEALLKNARHARGSTLIDHITALINTVRKLATAR